MDRRQLHDPMREAHLHRALAGRAEKYFRRRRVRIFFEEMMLDLPGEVVTQPVRQLQLIERVLI